MRGPAPASPDRGKVFTVEAFNIQVEQRVAVCPAGRRSTNVSRLEEKKTGKVDCRIEWSQGVCGTCPLRDQCVNPGQNHRTLVVGELHSLLQARRQEMRTEAFKREMHRRNGIDGTQSELVRAYGLRQARYRGKAKVRLQNYLIGAAYPAAIPPHPMGSDAGAQHTRTIRRRHWEPIKHHIRIRCLCETDLLKPLAMSFGKVWQWAEPACRR